MLAVMGLFRHTDPASGQSSIRNTYSTVPGGMPWFAKETFNLPGGPPHSLSASHTDVVQDDGEPSPEFLAGLSMDEFFTFMSDRLDDRSNAVAVDRPPTVNAVDVCRAHGELTILAAEHGPGCTNYQDIAYTMSNRSMNVPKPAAPHCFPSKMDCANGPDMIDEGFRYVAVKSVTTALRMMRNNTFPQVAEPYRLTNDEAVSCALDAISCPNQEMITWLVAQSMSMDCDQ
jgi:hypothetical protein